MKTAGNVKVAAKVARLVLQGLRLLQQWSCVVLECMAWKYTHPCRASVFKEKGGNPRGKGMEYERVVRYNWSPKELSALVEVNVWWMMMLRVILFPFCHILFYLGCTSKWYKAVRPDIYFCENCPQGSEG